jgi:hypothetical protein
MGVIGDLRKYTQFQAAEAMRAAASNPADGGAATGIGLGMGMAMAKQMADAMGAPAPAASPATPPPLPAGRSFHVARDGQPDGPFELAELRQQLRDGQLAAESLVWAEGMAGWEKAASVSELAPLFRAVPPPLPGT